MRKHILKKAMAGLLAFVLAVSVGGSTLAMKKPEITTEGSVVTISIPKSSVKQYDSLRIVISDQRDETVVTKRESLDPDDENALKAKNQIYSINIDIKKYTDDVDTAPYQIELLGITEDEQDTIISKQIKITDEVSPKETASPEENKDAFKVAAEDSNIKITFPEEAVEDYRSLELLILVKENGDYILDSYLLEEDTNLDENPRKSELLKADVDGNYTITKDIAVYGEGTYEVTLTGIASDEDDVILVGGVPVIIEKNVVPSTPEESEQNVESGSAAPVENGETSGKSKTLNIIVFALFALILIGGAVLFFFKRKNDNIPERRITAPSRYEIRIAKPGESSWITCYIGNQMENNLRTLLRDKATAEDAILQAAEHIQVSVSEDGTTLTVKCDAPHKSFTLTRENRIAKLTPNGLFTIEIIWIGKRMKR